MTDRKFTVIKGGRNVSSESKDKVFLSSFITDTRLMGVVTLYIHWDIVNDGFHSDFHQFFYFDAEEYGFETYRSVVGSNVTEITLVEQTLMGGLGGNRVDISQKEACHLIQKYVEINKKRGLPLPEGKKEYEFLLNAEAQLTSEEEQSLLKRQCSPIISEYQLLNYFLMRCFSKDYEAVEILRNGKFSLDILGDVPASTLCKNTIDTYQGSEGASYLCEALIEFDTSYMVVLSEVTISNMKVTSFEKRSSMQVTAAEAAMMLSRPEFVTVYEILSNPEEFDESLSDLATSTLLTMHENGRLFLSFHKNNNHVNKRIFRLNEDVFGLYYVTDYGQMIIASYSIQGIHTLEKELRRSSLSRHLLPISKYEFKEPVLYEFIQSDFDDFEEFLEFIKE